MAVFRIRMEQGGEDFTAALEDRGAGFETSFSLGVPRPARLQDKAVTPDRTAQTVVCDPGYNGLGAVTVGAIPSNYGLITWNGSTLTVS